MSDIKPPWAESSGIDDANRKLALDDEGEYVRLGHQRFGAIVRRVNELHLLAPSALDENGAREAFLDARRMASLLISDRLARRGWLYKLMAKVFGWV